jgi:hypothetical protein
MRDIKKHALDDFEESNLRKLRKKHESKWKDLKDRAKEEVQKKKWMDKDEKRCDDAQERAFWNRVRPFRKESQMNEGHATNSAFESENYELIELEKGLTGEALANFWEKSVNDYISILNLPRVKVSVASKRYI